MIERSVTFFTTLIITILILTKATKLRMLSIMKNEQEILDCLKQNQLRSTPRRLSLIKLLLQKQCLCDAHELLLALAPSFPTFNKTTLYRELERLTLAGLVRKEELGLGKSYYELNDFDHHHHFVCEKCGKIEKIELKRCIDFELVPKRYKVRDHSLKLYGSCQLCGGQS